MKRGQRGFSLIELMIVVAIVGLLVAIAVPSYRRYVIRANRADAKAALLQLAGNLERCYTNSTPYAYTSATCAAAVPLPFVTPSGTYSINQWAPGGGVVAQSWALQATPLGTQAEDLDCASFNLTNTGVQTVTGTEPPAQCWRR
jgi:type IV pilus assembly protein PilE